MQRGWLGVVMHFRGCSGEPNRNNRIYHSGETEDGTWFLRWLQREFGPAPTAAVGYSLGGNMLGCLLANEGDSVPLDAAVIVSARSCWRPAATIWIKASPASTSAIC
nr:putative hydrolase [Raoultella sp. NCTC 9187]